MGSLLSPAIIGAWQRLTDTRKGSGQTVLKLLIFIFCFLLLVTLVVKFLVPISERFDQLPIWKTEPWQTLKVPVIVLLVIMGIGLLLFVAIRGEKKHEKAEKEFAQSQGWIYSEYNDAQGHIKELTGKLMNVCPEKEFDLNNSITVESGKRSIFLFRCRYRVRDWGPKKREGFACLIESDRFAPVRIQIDISERNSIDRLLLSNQVNMGDSEFTRNFIVTSKDPVSAKEAVNGSLQAVLLDSKRDSPSCHEVSIGPGGAVILAGTMTPIEEWIGLVDFARRIESAFE